MNPTATISLALTALIALATPGSTAAWGQEGHRIIAAIAWAYLTPRARARAQELLAADHDPLTRRSFADRATWADRYRDQVDRSTASWHYIDLEIADPDPDPTAACRRQAASSCVTTKLEDFSTQLAAPGPITAKKIVAFKYILHLSGDITQPLHAADDNDRGGNCERVDSDDGQQSLHQWWDTNAVAALGTDPDRVARDLLRQIQPNQAAMWASGRPENWAMDSWRIAKNFAYNLPHGCGTPPTRLTAQYQQQAIAITSLQLAKGGIRLAATLNRHLR